MVKHCTRLLGFVLFFFIAYLMIKSAAKKQHGDRIPCKIEANLAFTGVVTEYNGGHEKKSNGFTFILNDTAIFQIPRSAFDFPLHIGDTITKIMGEHRYFISHSSSFIISENKQRDTVIYNCD
jgi:hypothetical protein